MNLGYTWYPKDWNNSEAVFELNLECRGLYRELIDIAMLNDNKTIINYNVWCRKFNVSETEIKELLNILETLKLIKINGLNLFIESCENRLKLIRAGRKGGRKSKRSVKPIVKPNDKQKESKKEIENKVNNNEFLNDCLKDAEFLEISAMQSKLKIETLKDYLFKFEKHLIQLGENKMNLKDFKTHFTFWLNKNKKQQNVKINLGI